MYIPPHFEETRVQVLQELVRARPLATVVTLSDDGINANHIPLHLMEGSGRFGTLQGHVARSNPMWSKFDQDVEALAIFQGPDSYISPSWYPTKREHGKVVPTWNYTVVHAYGTLRVIDDPVWLRNLLEALVSQHEAPLVRPWSISDAPREFIDHMIESIVGFEISVTRLIGKWKISQNQPERNQAGVVEGLKEAGGSRALEMAALLESK
jgi:transcriptional regulator